METTEEFIRWGAGHWGAVIATAIVTLAIIGGGRRGSLEARQKICRALAVVVGLIYVADSAFITLSQYHGSWEQNLPFHYCSMMLLVATFALWTRNRTACWVLYFGALTACLQGLITPALDADFPTPRFFLFFCLHGILMPAALAVPLLLGMRARLRDVGISLLLMDAYLLCIHPVNLLLGTNYGFTMESPVPGCILDYAGPAPWYYLLLQIPAFALFSLLRLPVRARQI
ncbi:MAG: TIGR02206 family membrane protein [Akkermansia sp.]|nr:TIGR02206 family membrane protein [Akkermansia sp.]